MFAGNSVAAHWGVCQPATLWHCACLQPVLCAHPSSSLPSSLPPCSNRQQGELLSGVRQVLGRSRFRFQPPWARIITGTDEGVFGWIALNYLSGAQCCGMGWDGMAASGAMDRPVASQSLPPCTLLKAGVLPTAYVCMCMCVWAQASCRGQGMARWARWTWGAPPLRSHSPRTACPGRRMQARVMIALTAACRDCLCCLPGGRVGADCASAAAVPAAAPPDAAAVEQTTSPIPPAQPSRPLPPHLLQ